MKSKLGVVGNESWEGNCCKVYCPVNRSDSEVWLLHTHLRRGASGESLGATPLATDARNSWRFCCTRQAARMIRRRGVRRYGLFTFWAKSSVTISKSVYKNDCVCKQGNMIRVNQSWRKTCIQCSCLHFKTDSIRTPFFPLRIFFRLMQGSKSKEIQNSKAKGKTEEKTENDLWETRGTENIF